MKTTAPAIETDKNLPAHDEEFLAKLIEEPKVTAVLAGPRGTYWSPLIMAEQEENAEIKTEIGDDDLFVTVSGKLAVQCLRAGKGAWLEGPASEATMFLPAPEVMDALGLPASGLSRYSETGAQQDDLDRGMLNRALALYAWQENAKYCERCGGALELVLLGWAKTCPQCDRIVYPRTDPAMIVGVHDLEGRLLLANNANWEPTRYSLLAGYTEAGETVETTVWREIGEEVGIEPTTLATLQYLGSQVWPLPRSLMLGYRLKLELSAQEADQIIKVDQKELRDARFFTRQEYLDAVKSGEVTTPSQVSFAYNYITSWLSDEDLYLPWEEED
ncbi:hypothetical protein BK816_02760 [Boudabousia tangfeifanii]|uniref:NAD(+) diphosphatase n=1 Tax=Boudabousia tangfeifanii TaxID=1912795 RepID=A0A1D9MJ78_9ACTO|nr:NAD(+) diphosphatase [Boudabousia tangfeifanii]AOZ72354.1 hypothetical protein BK816_02760 [Boudabousia tangfeifanii]